MIFHQINLVHNHNDFLMNERPKMLFSFANENDALLAIYISTDGGSFHPHNIYVTEHDSSFNFIRYASHISYKPPSFILKSEARQLWAHSREYGLKNNNFF